MNLLRIGVLGTGFMAKTHCEGWSTVKGAKVTGLCSLSGRGLDGKFSHVAGNLGDGSYALPMDGVTTTNKWEELVGGDFDVIDICLPTNLHRPVLLETLLAGKHVVCEKPLAAKRDDAIIMSRAAQKAKSFSMAAHCMLFWPGWAEVATWIRAGLFGKVINVHFKRVGPPPGWSPEFLNGEHTGGALTDLGIHDYVLALDMFGKPESVFARGINVVSSDGALDDVDALLFYKNGPTVLIETSWARNAELGFEARFEIRCERANITGGFKDGLQIHGAPTPDMPCPLLLGQGTGWSNQLHYFANCVRDNSAPAVATLSDALRALEVIEAVKLSAKDGQVRAVEYYQSN